MENIILEKEDKRKKDNGIIYSTSSSDFLNKLGYGVPLSESFPPIQTPPPSPIKSDSSTSEERTFTQEERPYLKPYSKEEKNIRSDDLRAHLYPDTEEVIPEGTTWGQMKKNYKKTFGKHIPKYETIEEMEENIYNVESHPIVIGGRKTKRTKKHKKSKTYRKTRKNRKGGKGRKSRKHRKSRRR
uniref:Uncharacterized protein n=1 Tax=viral metagenome TaxID=1070528 RepID=A0A6C0EUE4_9ZZZZ